MNQTKHHNATVPQSIHTSVILRPKEDTDETGVCPICLENLPIYLDDRGLLICCMNFTCRTCNEEWRRSKAGDLCLLCRAPVARTEAELLKRHRFQANKGKVEAQYSLGNHLMLLSNGHLPNDGTVQDTSKEMYQEGKMWLKKAAKSGSVLACYDLGQMFQNFAPCNINKAARWYERAAEMGFFRAQHNIGIFYEHGDGVVQDCAVAIGWFKKAGAQGFSSSYFNIGCIYSNKSIYPNLFNLETAIGWYSKAAALGHNRAPNLLYSAYIHSKCKYPCTQCGILGLPNVDIASCPGCQGGSWYCNKTTCRALHWKQHASICSKICKHQKKIGHAIKYVPLRVELHSLKDKTMNGRTGLRTKWMVKRGTFTVVLDPLDAALLTPSKVAVKPENIKPEAAQHLEKAEKAEEVEKEEISVALYLKGEHYREKGNLKKAIRSYKKSSEQGNVTALLKIGVCYGGGLEEGNFETLDPQKTENLTKALAWYTKAVDADANDEIVEEAWLKALKIMCILRNRKEDDRTVPSMFQMGLITEPNQRRFSRFLAKPSYGGKTRHKELSDILEGCIAAGKKIDSGLLEQVYAAIVAGGQKQKEMLKMVEAEHLKRLV